MGMSTHVVGIREPDDRWRQMKAVHDACTAADVPVPTDVEAFFDGEAPAPAGIKISLDHGAHAIAREWSDDHLEGVEITLADLPSNITVIRFYNSY